MALYRAEIEIEDDPASFGATVLIVADDRKAALKAAKKAAINSYYDHANGWALKPKVIDARCAQTTIPDKGVVLVSGDYHR